MRGTTYLVTYFLCFVTRLVLDSVSAFSDVKCMKIGNDDSIRLLVQHRNLIFMYYVTEQHDYWGALSY